MRTVKSHRILTVISAALVVMLIAGCGRRAEVPNAGSPTSPPPTVDVTTAPELPTGPLVKATVEPVMTDERGATAEPTAIAQPGATQPGTTPGPTPDLASIEALLSGIDGDLGDDADAAASEGSPQ